MIGNSTGRHLRITAIGRRRNVHTACEAAIGDLARDYAEQGRELLAVTIERDAARHDLEVAYSEWPDPNGDGVLDVRGAVWHAAQNVDLAGRHCPDAPAVMEAVTGLAAIARTHPIAALPLAALSDRIIRAHRKATP